MISLTEDTNTAAQQVETTARTTIDNLLAGKIGTKTIHDLVDAAQTAKRDRGVQNAITTRRL